MSITAHNVTKTFDGGQTFALKDVSVTIPQGEFVAIIGLSGAGKSTFLRTINGMCMPTGGHLNVLGQEVRKLRGQHLAKFRRQIGFVFQHFNLVKSISAIRNVLVGRIAYNPRWRAMTGFYPKSDLALAKRTLDSVGLPGRYHEKARNLSGGQQQRVAIARALVQKPRIILADEPMASLDPKLSEIVLNILARANQEQKITVIVNVHVLEYARRYADRILAFRRGEIVFDGPPAALTEEIVEKIYHQASHDDGDEEQLA
jgi:phosphonate transport system ATP-binding protein